MSTRTESQLRETICSITHSLYERGHNAPGDGNTSARLGEGFLCTPTGGHKGRLAPSNVVRLRGDGAPVDPSQRASTELALHLAIYRARPDVHAIVHAHSPHAVALTVAGRSLAEPVLPEAIAALGGIPTVPYASPTTSAVADAVLPYLERHDAFLLERHGPVCLGATLEEAHARLEIVEHTARITALALMLGGAPPIPADEAAKLRAMFGRV